MVCIFKPARVLNMLTMPEPQMRARAKRTFEAWETCWDWDVLLGSSMGGGVLQFARVDCVTHDHD